MLEKVVSFFTSIVSKESASPDPNFGMDTVTVFNNMMAVIKANIAPILILMGLMLGAGWVIKYFRKARKGSI